MVRRILGTLLILLGVLGISFCALGVVAVWRTAENVRTAADDTLHAASSTLDEIDHSLDLASTILDDAGFAITSLYTTTLEVNRTLSTTQVAIDEMADLTEDEVPQSVEASLMALDALEDSAGLIDRLLRSLAQLGIGSYNPAVPLDQTVAEARAGLVVVPASLRTMGAGLQETSESLSDIQEGVASMADTTIAFQGDLDEAEAAISIHRRTVDDVQNRIQNARESLEPATEVVAWGVTILLIWIGVSQLAIIFWGVSLWQKRRRETV
jgi:methyl-accepting chemotaxis protein